MPKVGELNLHGSSFFVCSYCQTLYTGFNGCTVGVPCPKCNRPLHLIHALTPDFSHYEADGRTM